MSLFKRSIRRFDNDSEANSFISGHPMYIKAMRISRVSQNDYTCGLERDQKPRNDLYQSLVAAVRPVIVN